MTRSPARQGEAGFALVTAVIAVLLVSAFALALVQGARTAVAGVSADAARARLSAAADAALLLAIRRLTDSERDHRWSIDGRPHLLGFDGVRLRIAVEDERGKVPLNQIDETQTRRLFATIGVEPPQLDVLTDSFLDWRDPDDEPRLNGAESGYYAARGLRARNGDIRSFDELLDMRGMTPALLARIEPIATVLGTRGTGFDDRFAQPLAVRIMGRSEVTVLERERELSGERAALALNDAETLVGRGLTIRVAADDGSGGHLTRVTLVQITGKRAPAFLVRAAA